MAREEGASIQRVLDASGEGERSVALSAPTTSRIRLSPPFLRRDRHHHGACLPKVHPIRDGETSGKTLLTFNYPVDSAGELCEGAIRGTTTTTTTIYVYYPGLCFSLGDLSGHDFGNFLGIALEIAANSFNVSLAC